MALKKIALALVFASAVALAGCSTTQFNGYANADNDDAKAVAQGQFNESASAQIAIVQNPDINGGILPLRALKTIQTYAISCQHQIGAQIAGGVQSAVNGAVPYGIGGVGVGAGATAGFPGAKFAQYTPYGVIADASEGAINGLVTGSYGAASDKGTCTRDFWDDKVKMDPSLFGTHVEVVYAGKAWGGSTPPNLEHSATAPPPKN